MTIPLADHKGCIDCLLHVAAHLSYKAAALKLSELATLDASSSVEQPPLPELTGGGGLLTPAPPATPRGTTGGISQAGLSGSRTRLAPNSSGAPWRDSASSSAVKPPPTRVQPSSGEHVAVNGDPLASVDGVRASVMDTLDGVPPRAAERPPADSAEPGRDQASPSALAPRLGVHGVVATLIGDATEDAAPVASMNDGDSSSGSSPVASRSS